MTKPDPDKLLQALERDGLGDWCPVIAPLLRERCADGAHGDYGRWRDLIGQLPDIGEARIDLDAPAVSVQSKRSDAQQAERLRALLMRLNPWRKGPFRIHGVEIDAEWRSDLKWSRLANEVAPLCGRRVLDVGCGNGYYSFRMIGAGADLVVGVDPTVLYVFQFMALNRYLSVPSIHVLPLRLNELPGESRYFDTTFSMGVLYHQRDPLQHLADLRASLRPRGELVLETLVFPGAAPDVCQPEGRYARMRNVWHLPTVAALEGWLGDAGFRDARFAGVTVTTTDEQRATDWMPFESLREALDPNDRERTVEGLPAPRRALVICTAP